MTDLATFCEDLEHALLRVDGVMWVEAMATETAMVVHLVDGPDGDPEPPIRIEVSYS